jgi:Ca2+-binding EF-hand superfamily protein
MKKLLVMAVLLGLCIPVLAQQKKGGNPDEAFKKMDKDGDGKLSLAEFKGKREGDKATKAEATFKAKDKDADGFLSLEEFKAGGKKKK